MRWVLRLIGLVAVASAVGLGALFFLPGDRIAGIAADRISQATGRTVTFSGDTSFSLYPILGVSTGAVEVANAPWSDAGPMLRAESLRIGVQPMALFGGAIRIIGLEVVRPEIRLERAADGRVNWDLGAGGLVGTAADGRDAPGRSAPRDLTLERALITGATLTITDHAGGGVTALRDLDLDLRWPDRAGPASFEAVLRPAGAPVRVAGQIDRLDAFIGGAVTGVQADVTGPGGQLEFTGRAGAQPQVQGRLSADLGDTAAFLAALGQAAAGAPPRGLGQSLRGAADLTLTPDMRLSLRDLALDLGGNRLVGAADVDLGGEVLRFNAQIDAGALDLSALTEPDSGGDGAGSAGGAGADSGADGWSRRPIDAGALGLVDGKLALTADSVDLGALRLGRTRTLMTLDRARAVFDLRELRAYDGLVTGEFVANNRAGLSVGGRMQADGIDLERFLGDVVGITRFSAAGSGTLRFLGVGPSVDAIMRSLGGEGRIATGRGVISGIDLDRLMRSGDPTGGTTIFDAMSASFTIDKGDLYNRDLDMRLPLARAEGAGRIGLGARDIDYLLTPVLLEGDTRRGLAIPVRITGPWASPRIAPDLERALDVNLRAERDKLEERAERKLDRALERELGVTPGPGQSLQDTLRKGLENEAGRALRKLFD